MKIEEYRAFLERKEVSESTLKKYMTDVKGFLEFLDGEEPSQDRLIEYKAHMKEKYKQSTVNSKITVLNAYMQYLGVDAKVKTEVVQRATTLDNVLSEKDYDRLIRMADRKGKLKMKMVMEILRYTGIRVSEIEFVTVEAVKRGYLDIENKGKTRRVALGKYITKQLKQYCKDNSIESGVIITNRSGEVLSRNYIFKQLKWIGGQARVRKDKVYPHSFRHLFAKWWLKKNNENVLVLADILGHSSVDTTRIYTTLSTAEQRETMDA